MTTPDQGAERDARGEHASAPDTHEQAFELLEEMELLGRVLAGEVDPLECDPPRCPVEQRMGKPSTKLRERIASSDPNDPELVVAVFDEIVRLHGQITADLGRLERRVNEIKRPSRDVDSGC